MPNPNVITMADYLHMDVPTIVKGSVQIMRENSPILNMLKFLRENRLRFFNRRGMSAVEGGTWKKIGEAYDKGVQFESELIEETTYYLGREFQVDERLMNVVDPVITDPIQSNIRAYTIGMQRQVCNAIVNGKSTDNNGDSFTGLKERLASLPTEQTLYADGVGSNYLDLRTSAADYAQNVEEFIVLMNKLCKAIDGGRPDFFIVNEDFQIKFESILRTSGLLTYTKDNMEREFPSFKGIPFIDIGRKEDDTTYIINNNEQADGSDGTYGSHYGTSIYAVKQGPEFLQMLEKQPFRVRENDNDPHMISHTVVMDWALGMMITHPRSVARLTGLRMA